MFMSPEQKNFIASVSHEVSLKHGGGNILTQRNLLDLPQEKVDIYAAGLVLFEMCGSFGTQMERCMAMDNLQKRREFPPGFKEKYF